MNETWECILQTRGYRVVFEIAKTIEENWFSVAVDLTLNPEFGGHSVSAYDKVHISGLKGTVRYLKRHIDSVRQGRGTDSHLFLPNYSNVFGLEAKIGEARTIDGIERGSFTMHFRVIAGYSSDAGSVYVGGTSLVDFDAIEAFTTSLEQIISELSAPG